MFIVQPFQCISVIAFLLHIHKHIDYIRYIHNMYNIFCFITIHNDNFVICIMHMYVFTVQASCIVYGYTFIFHVDGHYSLVAIAILLFRFDLIKILFNIQQIHYIHIHVNVQMTYSIIYTCFHLNYIRMKEGKQQQQKSILI